MHVEYIIGLKRNSSYHKLRIELEYMQYFLLDVEIDNHDMLYILLYKRENQVIHLGLLLDLIINHQTSMDKLWFI